MVSLTTLKNRKVSLKRKLAEERRPEKRRRLKEKLEIIRQRIREHHVPFDIYKFLHISPPVPVPTHMKRLKIIAHQVQFRHCTQPPLIFELLIEHLFEKFLEDKQTPTKIGFSFRIDDNERFYCPLRPKIFNTYATLSRELERHVMSGDPDFHIQGLKLHVKLTGQWPKPMSGACRNVSTPKLKSEIDISNPANSYCLAYSILAGMRRHELAIRHNNQVEKQLKLWSERSDLQRKAEKLLRSAGCSLNQSGYNREDVARIQNLLNKLAPDRYQIVIVEATTFLYKGPLAEHTIPIRYDNGHFTLLKNLATYMQSTSNYCIVCERACYRSLHPTTCTSYCRRCFRYGFGRPCAEDGEPLKCADCNNIFPNQDCFDYHKLKPPGPKSKPVCDHVKYCDHCKCAHNDKYAQNCPLIEKEKDPNCKRCGSIHDPAFPQVCWIPKFKETSKTAARFIFYDCEATQDTGKHYVNLIISHTTCAHCMDTEYPFDAPRNPANKRCVCPADKVKIFENFNNQKLNPGQQFLQWAMNKDSNRRFSTYCIAHNGGRYDNHIILEQALLMGLAPQSVSNGRRMYKMKISKKDTRTLEFLDSLAYFNAPLSRLPKMFELGENSEKLFFPHFYNQSKYLNVRRSTLPDSRYYGPDSMSPDTRMAFLQWYQTHRNQPFCLKEDIVTYCDQDVVILRQACTKFRSIMMEKVGIDPFRCSATLARLTMLIFQRNFMEAETLPNIPELGLRPAQNQSKEARKFFRLLEEIRGVKIRSAESAEGEASVTINGKTYVLDGVIYNEDGTMKEIFEYAGCWFHGCKHYEDRNTKLADGQTAQVLYAKHKERINVLKRHFNVPVFVHWACKFQASLNARPDLKERHDHIEIVEPLHPRKHGLRGGRVEPFRLLYDCADDEELLFLDIVSLYPYVMRTKEFPVGLPQVICPSKRKVYWKRPDQLNYKGLMMVKVRPPTNLKKPLLAYRNATNCLQFALCKTCADDLTLGECKHQNSEREFWGCFTTFELQEALRLKYKIVGVNEIWNWPEDQWRSGDRSIFKDFINLFLALKTQNSGFPTRITAIENANERMLAKLKYIVDYKEKFGIELKLDDIKVNESLKFVAKLFLNSLWGKYCQRVDGLRVVLTKTEAEVNALLDDPEIQIHDIQPLTPKIMRIAFKDKSELPRQPLTNNVPLGIFVTSHARLHLYTYLEAAGDAAVYVDTDSILFINKIGAPLPFEEGEFLGCMSREYSGFTIKRWVSGGPKNYALQMISKADGSIKNLTKIRGFTQTFTASQILTFENIRELVVRKINELHGQQVRDVDPTCLEDDDDEIVSYEPNILTVSYSNITRNIHGELHTRKMDKRYKFSYSKGIVLDSGAVLPFGYIP